MAEWHGLCFFAMSVFIAGLVNRRANRERPCNVVSLHSGLPISVVDLDRAREPFRVGIARPESEYVFDSAGQVIRLDGLLSFGSVGPGSHANNAWGVSS